MDSSDEKGRPLPERAGGPGTAAGDKPSDGDPYGYRDGPIYQHDYRGAVVWCPEKKFRGVSTGSRRSFS